MDSDIRTDETGAPTDLTGGMPATAGAGDGTTISDDERATFTAIADHLIPAAHGMPSAAEVVTDDRLRFVLRSRPDLAEPLRAALRPELGSSVADRLARLADEPTNLSTLQLIIVAGYYTDKRVREAIGYPGQMALELRSWEYPAYLEEGLIDAVLARGPTWRDPETGQRAVAADAPRTYAERWTTDARVARRRTRWPRSLLTRRSPRDRAGSGPSSRRGNPARARRSRTANRPRAGTWRPSPAPPRMTSRAPPRPPRPPSPPGPRRTTRSAPACCAGQPRSTKRTGTSSGPGRSARPAPLTARCITSPTSRTRRSSTRRPCRRRRTARSCPRP